MMKVSCIIPTYRFGGMDCLLGSLSKQTLSKNEWELILPDDLYEFRKKEVKEYAEQLDVPLIHLKPKPTDKPFGCGNAINTGLMYAEGDYVMIGQDFLWLEPDCFERHLKIQKSEGRVTVGYMPHMVAPPLANLEGKLTVFDRLHEEKPTVMELPDVRWTNVVPAPDLGEDYGRFEYHWYLTYYSVVPNATFPIQALIALNGYDERLDIGHGFNDDNLCFRLSRFLNYEFVLDKKNYMYHITHPWSRKEQHKEQANTHYNILNSILQGFMGVKAWNGYDLIQERCRCKYEKWVEKEGGMESPPKEETYLHPSQQARLTLIRKLCEDMESVLEVGCSSGYVLRNVAPKNARLAGIDINEKVIEDNKVRYPNIEWYVGNVTEGLPFPDDSFDVVLCFPKGTLVFGSLNPIEKMKQGDSAIGLKGKQQIKKVFSRSYNGPMVGIKTLDLPKITVTPEHPIMTTKIRRVHRKSKPHRYEYVKDKPIWKRSREISEDDWVLIPRIKMRRPLFLKLRIGLKGLGARRSRGRAGIEPTSFEDRRQFIRIKIDGDIAKILGLWIAEGHICKQRVKFSFGKHEGKLVEELCKLIQEKINLKPFVSIHESSITVAVGNKDLSKFMIQNFGRGALNKRIPKWLYEAEEEVIKGFIEGWWLGDGDLNKNTMRISTSSKKLAFGSLMLFYKIGVSPSLYYDKNDRSSTISSGPRWSISFSKGFWFGLKDKAGRKPYQRSRIDDEFVYLPITTVSQETFNGKVFNIETEDGTYSVPFLVHNCTEVLEHLPWEMVTSVFISGLKVAKKRLLITIPQATTLNYNRKWVESPHHRWALTLDRLYALTLNFIPGFWPIKPDFTLDKIQYWLDSDFLYFKIEKVKSVKQEDAVVTRAKQLYEAKAKEAEELKKKPHPESPYPTQWRQRE